MTDLDVANEKSDLNFRLRVCVCKLGELDSLRRPDRVLCALNRRTQVCGSPMVASTNLSSNFISEFALDSANAEAATSRVLDVLGLDLVYHVMV